MMMGRTLSKKPSKAYTRDPSRTGRVVKQYETTLTKLIKEVRKEAMKLLDEELSEQKELAKWRFDVKSFKAKLNGIIESKFKTPAAEAGDDVITKQIDRGVAMSDGFLSGLGVTPSLGVPFDNQLHDVLQERNLTSIMNIGDEVEKRIIQEVTAGVTDGSGIRSISKGITKATDFGISRAKTVARTETMNAYNKASQSRFESHGVKEVKWVVGGSNICTNVTGFDGVHYSTGCLGLNGKVFPIDDHPPVPLHPNCKCILQPVIERVS